MVRNYVRKTNRGTAYSKDELEAAIDMVQKGEMTQTQASLHFSIPRKTLSDRLSGRRGKKSPGSGRAPSIPFEMEKRLADGLKTMEKWGFGLSRKEIMEVVGDFVRMNGLVTPFKDFVPGADWFISFMKRHNLSIKKPQSVEYARKKMTDPFVVQEYFQLLSKTLDDLQLHDQPDKIWNLDETSFSMDPSKTKVVGKKGAPSSRTTATCGKVNTTVLSACSASGRKAPPLIVFKGKHVWDKWMAEEGKGFPHTSYAASVNGWMETEIFANFFEKSFVPFLSKERPVLLIYDGHATHIGETLIRIAMRENITILKLPPHTSHILQPLDLSVFKSLKTSWDQKLVQWQRQHYGAKLPRSMFSTLLGETWTGISPRIIVNGFVKAGIHPFNSSVISETQYDPSALQRWKKRNMLAPLAQVPGAQGTHGESSQRAHGEDAPEADGTDEVPGAHDLVEVNKTVNIQILPNATQDLSPCVTPTIEFETLLLNTVKQSPLAKPSKKTRLAPGAEVITSENVLSQLIENKAPKPKKARLSLEKSGLPKKKLVKNELRGKRGMNTVKPANDPTPIKNTGDTNSHPTDADILAEGKWVLVKYASKRSILHHYAGLIVSKNHSPKEGDWNIRFLKFKGGFFTWPVVDDIDTVSEEDVLKILGAPTADRRGSTLSFTENLSDFNIC